MATMVPQCRSHVLCFITNGALTLCLSVFGAKGVCGEKLLWDPEIMKVPLNKKHQEKPSSYPSAYTRPPVSTPVYLWSLFLLLTVWLFFFSFQIISFSLRTFIIFAWYFFIEFTHTVPPHFIFNAKMSFSLNVNSRQIRFEKHKFDFNQLLNITSFLYQDTASTFALLWLWFFSAESAMGGSRGDSRCEACWVIWVIFSNE